MTILSDIVLICITSSVSIAVLFLFCRLGGQRQIGQMSMFDYINSITIGSIAAEFATDLEQWWQPLTATAVYGLICTAISLLCCKSLKMRRFFTGSPLILYQHGRFRKKNLLRARLTLNEFLAQCRLAGYFDLSQLEAAVLETSGSISFLPCSGYRPVQPQDLRLTPPPEGLHTCLILDGRLLPENLKHCGKDEQWLMQQLRHRKIRQISDVLLACCDRNGELTVYPDHSGAGQQLF